MTKYNLVKRTSEYFDIFNSAFFEKKLNNVKVEWSDRMKTSAAIYYPDNSQIGFGKLRLNRRILSLRSNKELIETLLVRKIVLDTFIS